MLHSDTQSLRELHLCNNQRHLLFALADILGRDASALVIYLEDQVPLNSRFKTRLQALMPQVDFVFTTDAIEMAKFIQLPWPVPRVVRRNWRAWGTRALDWKMPLLNGEHFSDGYLYHTGFFSSKSASASCKRRVMREAGLQNYVTHRVSGLKALLRGLSGLSAWQQTWGEEIWIDQIDASDPERLPARARHKAKKIGFSDLYEQLNPRRSAELVAVFAPTPPKFGPQGKPRALILTQPLDIIGLAPLPDKIALYSAIAAKLIEGGYHVHVKHHPTDVPFALAGAEPLDADFPIELWPVLDLPRFDLAVALCSASLSEARELIADRSIQLLELEGFNAAGCTKLLAHLPQELARLNLEDKAR